jgi:hypothetical protein
MLVPRDTCTYIDGVFVPNLFPDFDGGLLVLPMVLVDGYLLFFATSSPPAGVFEFVGLFLAACRAVSLLAEEIIGAYMVRRDYDSSLESRTMLLENYVILMGTMLRRLLF